MSADRAYQNAKKNSDTPAAIADADVIWTPKPRYSEREYPGLVRVEHRQSRWQRTPGEPLDARGKG